MRNRLNDPVAVTGMGIVSNQGVGCSANWHSMINTHEHLAPWRQPCEPKLAGINVAQTPELPRPDDLPPTLWQSLAGTQRLAAIAADEAIRMAALPTRPTRRPEPIALFMATTVCGMDLTEQFYRQYRQQRQTADIALLKRVHPFEINVLLAHRHRLTGPRWLCMSTCVSSAMAIGAAVDSIRTGQTNMALAGGAEALCEVVLSGFSALKLVAPEGCTPFAAGRRGITVGEGSAVLVLESLASAAARRIQPLAYIRGVGMTCDAYHITGPEPTGAQPIAAMRQALQQAALRPDDIGYVNAHGTGTRDNDAMEARALNAVFGSRTQPFISSTKRLTGHTFASAGAIETVISAMALQHGVLPANAGAPQADPTLGVNVIAQPTERRVEHALTCNFAFGGNNTSIVISRGTGRTWETL